MELILIWRLIVSSNIKKNIYFIFAAKLFLQPSYFQLLYKKAGENIFVKQNYLFTNKKSGRNLIIQIYDEMHITGHVWSIGGVKDLQAQLRSVKSHPDMFC